MPALPILQRYMYIAFSIVCVPCWKEETRKIRHGGIRLFLQFFRVVIRVFLLDSPSRMRLVGDGLFAFVHPVLCLDMYFLSGERVLNQVCGSFYHGGYDVYPRLEGYIHTITSEIPFNAPEKKREKENEAERNAVLKDQQKVVIIPHRAN